MSLVGRPVRAPHEIAPEAAKCISWLRRRLLSWFLAYGRSFPWRDPDRTPYEVVVAEMLLHRTTAVGVARTYAGFVDRFPSWVALAQSPLEELENALRLLGLWRRKAQAFQHLAQSIEANGGVVPHTRKELERLPGIGPYAASAVLAIVYGGAAPRCKYGPPPGSAPRLIPRRRGKLQTHTVRACSSSGTRQA